MEPKLRSSASSTASGLRREYRKPKVQSPLKICIAASQRPTLCRSVSFEAPASSSEASDIPIIFQKLESLLAHRVLSAEDKKGLRQRLVEHRQRHRRLLETMGSLKLQAVSRRQSSFTEEDYAQAQADLEESVDILRYLESEVSALRQQRERLSRSPLGRLVRAS